MSTLVRSGQTTIPASAVAAVKILPLNPARRRVLLTVPVAASVYIGGDPGVSASTGFALGSTSTGTLPDRLELNTIGEVWGFPPTAAAVTVSWLEEIA